MNCDLLTDFKFSVAGTWVTLECVVAALESFLSTSLSFSRTAEIRAQRSVGRIWMKENDYFVCHKLSILN